MVTLSIILPTYNESEAIITTITAIKKVLQKYSLTYEIVICDDNSTDGTANLIKIYKKSHRKETIQIIERKSNPGLGLSIKDGVAHATGSIIIGMDADGNHDPVSIPLLLSHLKKNNLIIASRFVSCGGMVNKLRYYPTKIVNTFFSMLGMPVRDSTSGYYACFKKDLQKLPLKSIYYGYGDYHLRLVWFAQMYGWDICEVPTFYGERAGGTSKSQLISMLITYTIEIFRLRNLKNDQIIDQKNITS